MAALGEWNVVITVSEHAFAAAREWLARFGKVRRTDYYNVLVLQVEDTAHFPDALKAGLEREPAAAQWLSRIVPLSVTFGFQDAGQFEHQARRAVEPWARALRGKRFHVRMHRRGFKGRLSSQHEETFLDHFLIEAAGDGGTRVDFDDPDIVIALETVGQRGGVSRWTREDRRRYPFLKLD